MRSDFWPDIFQYSPQCQNSYQGKQKNFSQDDNHAPQIPWILGFRWLSLETGLETGLATGLATGLGTGLGTGLETKPLQIPDSIGKFVKLLLKAYQPVTHG
jgi:hypothetical protein